MNEIQSEFLKGGLGHMQKVHVAVSVELNRRCRLIALDTFCTQWLSHKINHR